MERNAEPERLVCDHPRGAYPGGLDVGPRRRADGFVRVYIRSRDGVHDGDWLEGFNFEEGTGITGDSVGHVVHHAGRPSLDGVKGQSIRLHFWMQNAELYSFWFQ